MRVDVSEAHVYGKAVGCSVSGAFSSSLDLAFVLLSHGDGHVTVRYVDVSDPAVQMPERRGGQSEGKTIGI